MITFNAARASVAASVLTMFAGTASASSLTVINTGIATDAQFVSTCGGSDNFGCEWLVAEGRIGDQSANATWETGIFNRISNGATTSSTNASDYAGPNGFTLAYDGMGKTELSFLGETVTVTGVDFGVSYAGDNPTAPAQSLVIRSNNATLSNLAFNSHSVPGGLGGAGVNYLSLGGADFTQAWTLTGDAQLDTGFTGSSSAFQVKVTDVAPVPLPAPVLLLGAALGALGFMRRRAA